VKLAKPHNKTEYLAIIDRVVGKIDGVLPSTLFNRAPASFKDGPDGTFFGIVPIRSPVNELELIEVLFFTRQGGKITNNNPGTIRYSVTTISDNVLYSGTGVITPLSYLIVPGNNVTNNLPDDAYKLTACVLKNNGECDQDFTDTTYFPHYSKPWRGNKVRVIGNSGRPLHVVDAGGATDMEVFPNLLVLSNAVSDITVSDGVTNRVITPTPIPRTVFFVDRDQPYLKSVVNAATFKEGPVVPGSIATLFTWGATQGDPEISQTNPLPINSCNGRTQVLFTGSDGREFSAPFFYCSQLQLNVQVPTELRGQEHAWVRVQLGDSFSNQMEVQVADANPGIFMIDPDRKIGAVIFAVGDKAGQLVTPENPAHPGDYLSVFATGLGETIPSMPGDGMAAPLPPPLTEQTAAVFMLYTTLRPVMASANDAPWLVTFSGLAPGFVGLYQVNVQVPINTAPGMYPFTIAVEGSEKKTVSNEITIAVQ